MKKILALLFAFSFPFLSSGCSSLQPFSESAAAKIAVQQATLRVIDEDVERAQRVIAIVDGAQDQIVIGRSVALDVLEEYVRYRIDWSELSIADAQLVQMLLDQLRMELEARFGEELLDPEDRAAVRVVLRWISDAAGLVILMRGE